MYFQTYCGMVKMGFLSHRLGLLPHNVMVDVALLFQNFLEQPVALYVVPPNDETNYLLLLLGSEYAMLKPSLQIPI